MVFQIFVLLLVFSCLPNNYDNVNCPFFLKNYFHESDEPLNVISGNVNAVERSDLAPEDIPNLQ